MHFQFTCLNNKIFKTFVLPLSSPSFAFELNMPLWKENQQIFISLMMLCISRLQALTFGEFVRFSCISTKIVYLFICLPNTQYVVPELNWCYCCLSCMIIPLLKLLLPVIHSSLNLFAEFLIHLHLLFHLNLKVKGWFSKES